MLIARNELAQDHYGLRGHGMKLTKERSRLDTRKSFFSQRAVNGWNRIPAAVVNAELQKRYGQQKPMSLPVHQPTSTSTSTVIDVALYRLHTHCSRPCRYTAVYGPCTRVHTAVYMARTWLCRGRVHTQTCTGHVHGHGHSPYSARDAARVRRSDFRPS